MSQLACRESRDQSTGTVSVLIVYILVTAWVKCDEYTKTFLEQFSSIIALPGMMIHLLFMARNIKVSPVTQVNEGGHLCGSLMKY